MYKTKENDFLNLFWWNDSDVNAYEVNKRSAEYIFDLPNIAFWPKMSGKCTATCNLQVADVAYSHSHVPASGDMFAAVHSVHW